MGGQERGGDVAAMTREVLKELLEDKDIVCNWELLEKSKPNSVGLYHLLPTHLTSPAPPHLLRLGQQTHSATAIPEPSWSSILLC